MQSKFVLGTARKIYLVIASLSLLVAILAAAAVLLLQLWLFKPAPQVPVPGERAAQPIAMDMETVAQSLQPPRNLRFVAKPIMAPLSATDVIGYFDADTSNGLAAFPNDFDIFGGPDAGQFERVPVNLQTGMRVVLRAGLKPSPTLLDQINRQFAMPGKMRSVFSIVVVARDRFGNTTKPTSVTFSLLFGVPPPAPRGQQQAVPAIPLSQLQLLAHAIALHLDPKKTTAYFDQYRRALQIPGVCGTSDDNPDFLRGFGAAFNALKAKLTIANIEPFYAGVCTAWQQGVANETSAQQASDAARNEAMAKNMAAQAEDAIEKLGVSAAKYIAMSIVAGAVSAFLFISLFLAFLAIENHSDALRRAVEAIAGSKGSGA